MISAVSKIRTTPKAYLKQQFLILTIYYLKCQFPSINEVKSCLSFVQLLAKTIKEHSYNLETQMVLEIVKNCRFSENFSYI